jgi:hypothetical protein
MAGPAVSEIPRTGDVTGDSKAAAKPNGFSWELRNTNPNQAFSAEQNRIATDGARYQSSGILPTGLQLVDSTVPTQPTIYERPALQAVQPMQPIGETMSNAPFDSNQKLNIQVTNVPEVSQGILPQDSLKYLSAFTKSGADTFSTPIWMLLDHMAQPSAFDKDAANTAIHFAQSPNQFNSDAQVGAGIAKDQAAKVSDELSKPMSVDGRANMAGTIMPLFLMGDEPLKPEVTKQMGLETKSAEELEKLGINKVEVPVNPISGNTEEKLAQLQTLTTENTPLVENFMQKIDSKYGTASKLSVKDPAEIVEKASRPSILEKQPWFDVEHVRDTFRFKTPVDNLEDLPKIAKDLKESGFEIIKVDTDKLLTPKGRGWRMVAFDLKAPNGQMIEYQVLPKEMNAAGDAEHGIYEQFRNKDVATMTPEEQILKRRTDMAAQNLYTDAWEAYLKRTGQTEKEIKQIVQDSANILSQE